MDVKGYPRLFVRGVEALIGRKIRKTTVSNGGILDGHYHRARVKTTKAIDKGKKHIPAPKAVVLND